MKSRAMDGAGMIAYSSGMTHDTLLDAYARLTIRSGLNLQSGLVI